jgi:hypothetical protein
MDERILPSPVQQIIFVSRETSNCPLIAQMIQLGHTLGGLNLSDSDVGIASLDYGKRLLINGKNTDIKKMNRQDVVEIVDYDPLKNIIMVIGTKDPCIETPVHWIIQKARHDINVLLQINSRSLVDRLKGTLPTTRKETNAGTLEQAKELLRTFREGRTILLRNQAVVCAGINIQEIETALQKMRGELK